jgi:murein DD-endopeptidase MepM/ murein hydrolase activator NlpD
VVAIVEVVYGNSRGCSALLASILGIAVTGCSHNEARPANLGVPSPPCAQERILQRDGGHRFSHIGVDFNVCSSEHVVAVGDGIVGFVHRSRGSDVEKGDTVMVYHRLPTGGVLKLMYMHLSDVRVRDGEMLKRGQRIGSVWIPISFPWPPHVHVQLMGSGDTPAERDPLQYIVGCQSVVSVHDLIYPVSC